MIAVVLFTTTMYLKWFVIPQLPVSQGITLSYMEGLLTIPYCVMSFNLVFKLSAKIFKEKSGLK